MSLAPGTRLGSFEILFAIGAGGMGEVYRARDTRLNRDVALKVLPDSVAGDPDRLARFKREAQMASALNHPHILTVHDVGEVDQRPFLVSEIVDGGTLADWTQTKKRSWREIVDLLVGVADGLAAAHSAGILHRDVKPTNVLVTKNGHAKLADFGLAKRGAQIDERQDLATVTETQAGMLVGTVGYMSPEQANGEPLDERSDIFSFGIVLYEALTGQRPFEGRSTVDILHAIVHQPLAPMADSVPLALRMILQKSLEKNPAERYQSMREIVVDLKRLPKLVDGAHATPLARVPVARAWWVSPAALAAALAVGALLARQLAPTAAVPTEVPIRDVGLMALTDLEGVEESPAISPDGKAVAFVARSNGHRQVWIRLLAGGQPLQITRDDYDHEQPRWSPDSGSLIYYSPSSGTREQGAIWEIAALGGAPRRIASALTGGDISHDGQRIALFRVEDGNTELAIISRDGARTERTHRFSGERQLDNVRWSPDDQWLAFRRVGLFRLDEGLHVIPASGGEEREITHATMIHGFSWLPDGAGFVVASSGGSTVLYPPTFQLRLVGLDGTRDRQLTVGDGSYLQPDATASGGVVASRVRSQSNIWRFPVGGSPQDNARNGRQITRQTAAAQTPSVSPDGKHVVYLSNAGGHGNLWIVNEDGSGVRQLTFEKNPAVTIGIPLWSPTGEWINFVQNANRTTSQWLIRPDGSELHQLVSEGSASHWSTDGRWLYFSIARNNDSCVDRVPVGGGPSIQVRCGNIGTTSISRDQNTLYFLNFFRAATGGWDFNVHRAQPPAGHEQVIGRIAGTRAPFSSALLNPSISPDDRWLAMGLVDRGTTNLWGMSTETGALRQFVDFGARSTEIIRRVSWSADSRHLYAAVAETDADIVLFDGLLRR